MHPKKYESINALSSEERYGYLIRKAADSEKVYTIKDGNNRLVTLGDENVESIIPIFPEIEFANAHLKNEWRQYLIEENDIYEIIERLSMEENKNVLIAGFPNESLNSVVVTVDEFVNHLRYELQQYE